MSKPKITAVVSAVLYAFFVFFNPFPEFFSSKILFVRIPEVLFGMLFVLKIKTVRSWAAFLSLAVLAANSVLKLQLPASLQTTYVGISSFLLLIYCSKWLNRPFVRAVCHTVGKYSYAVFLTHHVIIDELALRFPMSDLNRSERYLLFLVYLCMTGAASWLLYRLHAALISWVRRACSNV